MWHVPRSCLCFQVSEDLSSAFHSQPEEREYWVTSSGTPTLRQCSWRGWKTRAWSRHLFGAVTSKKWTHAGCAVALTSSAEASPARTSPLPDEAKASAASDQDFGQRSSVWLMRYDRDTSSWRTSQRSLLEDYQPSLPTLPRSGSMRSGYVYEHPTWAPHIDASGGSAWPTPNAHDGYRPGNDEKSTQGGNLRRDAAQWMTDDGHWTTPNSSETGGSRPNRYAQGGRPLTWQCDRFHRDRETSTHGDTSPTTSRRRLNPAFVCWLMGLPWWWTRAEPISFVAAEMESYLSRLRWHLENLCGG